MRATKEIIVLGSDHGGFKLKKKIGHWLNKGGYKVLDVGAFKQQADDDYPLFALLVASKVADLASRKKNVLGILVCRSGGGMALTANKVKGARAVDVFSLLSARHARQHNHANILTLGQDFLVKRDIPSIINAWLKTKPSTHPRHQRRLGQIKRAEQGHIEVTPGILEKNFDDIKHRLYTVAGLSRWVHIDIADNTLVPNKTFLNLLELKRAKTKAKKEIHLMVSRPLSYLPSIKSAGFKRAFVHVESRQAKEFIKQATKARLAIGLAIDINTPVTRIKKFMPKVSVVLIMGIKAGWAGQPFRSEALQKVVKVKERWPKAEVVVDGGVHADTVKAIAAAGASRVIANSAIFNVRSSSQAIYKLTNYDKL